MWRGCGLWRGCGGERELWGGGFGVAGAGAAVGCCALWLHEEGLEVVGAEQLGERALEQLHAGLEIVRIWHGRSTG